MATARLRKTFQYPGEDGDAHADLDEEEQEKVIESLAKDDAATTAFYKKTLSLLPLTTLLYYVVVLAKTIVTTSSSSAYTLALSQIMSTAVSFLVLHDLRIPGSTKSQLASSPEGTWIKLNRWLEARQGLVFLPESKRHWLPLVGVLVNAVVWLFAWRASRGGVVDGAASTTVFCIVLFATRELRPIDVEQLEGMKYQYKGA